VVEPAQVPLDGVGNDLAHNESRFESQIANRNLRSKRPLKSEIVDRLSLFAKSSS
jgi:hypothetical protein